MNKKEINREYEIYRNALCRIALIKQLDQQQQQHGEEEALAAAKHAVHQHERSKVRHSCCAGADDSNATAQGCLLVHIETNKMRSAITQAPIAVDCVLQQLHDPLVAQAQAARQHGRSRRYKAVLIILGPNNISADERNKMKSCF